MLYNEGPPASIVTVSMDAHVLTDADVRDMELVRSRRALAYLKDKIGNERMLELLASDLDEATRQVAGWVEESNGRWQSGALLLRTAGPGADTFHDWFMGNMARQNEPIFRAGHPDHFVNHPLKGGAEVVENVGEDDLPWHIFLEFRGADTDLPAPWDSSFPADKAFAAVIKDRNGLLIGSAMHELRDFVDPTEGTFLEAKLTIILPAAAPSGLVSGHLRHFAMEFRNWTEMARAGIAQPVAA
jgi:hypothetical protein